MTDLELAKELQKRLGLNKKASWMQSRIINKTDELQLAIITYGLQGRVIDMEKLLNKDAIIDADHIINSGILHSITEKDFMLLYLEYDIFIDKKLEMIEKREKISYAYITPLPPKASGYMKDIY